MAEETETTKSNQTLDLEARLEAEKAAKGQAPVEGARTFAVEGNDTSAYVGVDPEYQTYANETEAPSKAEEGAEKVFEERVSGALDEITENSKTIGLHGYNTDSKLLAAEDEGDATRSDSETSQATPPAASSAPADDKKASEEEQARIEAEAAAAAKNNKGTTSKGDVPPE